MFKHLNIFAMSMVTITLGCCSCFPSGRVELLWQAPKHINESIYGVVVMECGERKKTNTILFSSMMRVRKLNCSQIYYKCKYITIYQLK